MCCTWRKESKRCSRDFSPSPESPSPSSACSSSRHSRPASRGNQGRSGPSRSDMVSDLLNKSQVPIKSYFNYKLSNLPSSFFLLSCEPPRLHGKALHGSSSFRCGQVTLPISACSTILLDLALVPPPQVTLQLLHGDQSPTSQLRAVHHGKIHSYHDVRSGVCLVCSYSR